MMKKTGNIKRITAGALLMLVICNQGAQTAFGQITDMGFFGGISQGQRLPKTTEILLQTNASAARATTLPYKEVVFLTGEPIVFEGTMGVRSNSSTAGKTSGTYTEAYTVARSAATGTNPIIQRDINFSVNFRVEGSQTIKDYQMTRWTETITTGGQAYRLDDDTSFFNVSIIEDKTPGCTYYKGNISQRAVYLTGAGDATQTYRVETSGTFYGYENAWSSTGAQRLDVTVYAPEWQMQYQIRPSVSVNKTLQYSENEPTAISFSGNYQEVMQNLSGLQYDILVKPQQFYNVPSTGNANISSFNTFEQLIAPDLNFLKGHFAEQDIKKLFAMQILDGDPKFYQPSQAITRDQFVTALVKAIKLPVEQVRTTTSSRGGRTAQTQKIVFPDVTQDRPTYPYIMAAFNSGLAVGRSDGKFYSDYSIERQEAVTILLRTLGLQNLGLDPTPVTPFTDDASIADWAKREVYAAYRLGIISPDDNGAFNPKKNISKAEAAALINRLVDYMRSGIADDYSSNIVNYTR